MRHRTFLKAVAAAAAVLSAGVHAAPPGAGAPARPRVALIMKSLANEFFLTMENGARAHQQKNSSRYELLTSGIKDEADTAGQIALIEQMLVARVNAIVVAPVDSRALVAAVKRAQQSGIVVVNIDNQFDPAALKEKAIAVPFVGPQDRKGAEKVGAFVAQGLKAGDKVAIIEGLPNANNSRLRVAGFQDAARAAGLKVVASQSGDWEIDKASRVAAALLRETPDLKAILCANDSMAMGAVAAVKSAGRGGKVKVAGFDNLAAVAPMLKDGRLSATADQHAGQLAVYGIETALTLLAERKTPGKSSVGAVVETPVDLIAGRP